MQNIVYYNVSHDLNVPKVPNGTILSVTDLFVVTLKYSLTPDDIRQKILSLKIDGLDPIGIKNPSRWESLLSLIIYCLSGKFPLRQEVLRGRQIMMALPRDLKKPEISRQIAFSLLPYILIGFKGHIENRFQEDSNIVSDIVAFIVRLSKASDLQAISFLCAHRGKSVTTQHVLIDSVHTQKAQVAINLIKGILANNPWTKTSSICWYQQGPTEWASLNMFPEMFLQYLAAGDIQLLLTTLGRHLKEIEDLMYVDDLNAIKTEVRNLDFLTTEVVSFLSGRYGDSWRLIDYSNSDFIKVGEDRIVEIALEITLPEVLRLMPFYSVVGSKEVYIERKKDYIFRNTASLLGSDPVRATLVAEVIERFFQNQTMTPTAKAVYETTFYYLWGKRTALNERELAIGLDRDHSHFQYLAWVAGYNDVIGKTDSIPMLYARRVIEGATGSALKDYSIRQFWR